MRTGWLVLGAIALCGCGDDAAPPDPSEPPPELPAKQTGTADPAMEEARVEPPSPADQVTSASPHEHAPPPVPPGPFGDDLGVMELVARNRARMTAERSAPVHVIAERDPIEAGRRICEAVVPRRPPNTPVLLKPNLSGIDMMRDRIDNGLELRTTGIEFLRGVVRCLRARGHREITVTDAWSRLETRERWLQESGLQRLIDEEGVRFVGLWEDRGPDGRQSPMLAAPFPEARRLRDDLMVPRLVARHLRDGLFISIPKLKMHRYAVTTLSIKNNMGLVIMRGAEAPESHSGAMHEEIGPWLSRYRAGQDDRDAYVRSLELFAERIVDVLEIELPDAVLIDGVPPVAGDGFALNEPFDEGVAIGSTNPVLADAVGSEYLGYLDNSDLRREIRHGASPLLEEAARRFYGSTDVLHGIAVTGDASFREGERAGRVAHYRAFPGFEIGRPPSPMGPLPWIARAITATAAVEAPVIDGVLDDAVWQAAAPAPIDRHHAGRPAGPETIARLAWTLEALHFAFDCAYDDLDVPDGPVDVEDERLYEHDVVELFLDPTPRSRESYREIEVGPRGHFLDIDVDLDRRPRGDVSWSSGMTVRTRVDEAARRFTIEGSIPAAAFGRDRLGPGEWRVNLYRIAGHGSARTHLVRYPGYTARPQFHLPDRFGWMRLVPRGP